MESSTSLSTPPDTRWFGTSRFFGELHKVGHLPNSGNRLSGVGSELKNNDFGSPRRKDSQVPNKDNTLLIKVFTCQPSSIACLIGLLSASIQAITVSTYRGWRDRLSHAATEYDTIVLLTPEARWELNWWITSLENSNGRKIRTFLPNMVIHSDASLVCRGAKSKSVNIGGAWNGKEHTMHAHQLAGGPNSLAECPSSSWQPVGSSIYQPHGGHRFRWPASFGCLSWQLRFGSGLRAGRLSGLKARHLPGNENMQADRMLRVHQDLHELEVVSRNIQQHQQSLGSASGGPFCNPVISTAGLILQMENHQRKQSMPCYKTGR